MNGQKVPGLFCYFTIFTFDLFSSLPSHLDFDVEYICGFVMLGGL